MTDATAPASSLPEAPRAQFDDHAQSYDDDLQQGLRLSGESPDYFARGRAQAVARYAASAGLRTGTVVEFGCGIGNNVPFLRSTLNCSRFIGLDVSPAAIDVARRRYGDRDTTFALVEEYLEHADADVVFINGVLHHVPAGRHMIEIGHLHALLRPGGLLALFENNPLNPGTHLVMRRIPFDREAVMINPYRMRAMVTNAGFVGAQIRFHFIFPRLLCFLRRSERRLERLPLGAQYCVLARRA